VTPILKSGGYRLQSLESGGGNLGDFRVGPDFVGYENDYYSVVKSGSGVHVEVCGDSNAGRTRAERATEEGTTTDTDRVAHLLPYCDAMFMDNGCRSLLLDVPTALRPPETTKVFSLNVKAQFLDYLRSIRDGISAEHVQAIREVYGDDHLGGCAERATSLISVLAQLNGIRANCPEPRKAYPLTVGPSRCVSKDSAFADQLTAKRACGHKPDSFQVAAILKLSQRLVVLPR
jgi:hypothetical protein